MRLSVYVHIPFCVKKCGYCDFLSFSGMREFFDAYTDKLINEIKIKSAQLKDYEVKTIFFGGGTPTTLKPEQLGAVLNTIKSEFKCAAAIETTIEANPKTVDAAGLSILKSFGFNRISFGLQSNSNRLLKQLDRIHDKETFEVNFYEARSAGFDNINIDIMFALPNQSINDWDSAIDYVISLKPEHISAYGLAAEDNTPLYEDIQSGKFTPPDEQTYLEMYSIAKRRLTDAGFNRYEISNFARPGCECKHNIVYWRCLEYVGFGLGASSYINSFRFCNERDLRKYLENDSRLKFEVEKTEFSDAVSEFMFMGLRMARGISKAEFKRRFGKSAAEVYGGALSLLINEGLMAENDRGFFLTDKGIVISNYVFSQFIF